jgi:hypothetical protein
LQTNLVDDPNGSLDRQASETSRQDGSLDSKALTRGVRAPAAP